MIVGTKDAYLTEIILALRDQLSAESQKALGSLERMDEATDEVTKSFKRAGQESDKFGQTLKSLGINALAINEIRHLLQALLSPIARLGELSDIYKELQSRVNFYTGSQQATNEVMERLGEIAQESRTPLEAVGSLYARLAQGLKEQNVAQGEVLTITQAVSDALLIYGASSAEAAGAIMQFSQAMASGTLRGEEFNSVAEQMPLLLEPIAKVLNTNVASLRALAKEGEITSDVMRKAIGMMAGEWREMAADMPLTISRAWTNLTSAMTEMVGTSQDVRFITTSLTDAMTLLAENLDTVVGGAKQLANIGLTAVLLSAAKAATADSKAMTALAANQNAAVRSSQALATASYNQAQARVAAAQAELKSIAALAQSHPQLVQNELYQRRLTAALQEQRLAYQQLSIASRTHATAMSQVLAPAGALARGIEKVKTAFLGLASTIKAIGWAFVISELIELTVNLGRLGFQLNRESKASDDLASSQERLGRVIESTLAKYAKFADLAILSKEQLSKLNKDELQQYQELRQYSSNYWKAVELEAKRAGDASRQAFASDKVEKYESAVQAAVSAIRDLADGTAAINPLARELVEAFTAIQEKGRDASAGVAEMAKELRATDYANAMVGATQLALAIQALSERSKVTARDVTEGLAPALAKLSGDELKNFAKAWELAVKSIDGTVFTQTAEVMGTLLDAALKKLSLSLESIRTGTTETGRDMLSTFEAVAIAAQGDAEVIGAAFSNALAKMASTKDIDALGDALFRLAQEGRISFETLSQLTGPLNARFRELKATTGDVASAFQDLGVKSSAELKVLAEQARKSFLTVKTSGESSLAVLRAAFEAYAKKAVESGDQAIIAMARQEAEALGLTKSWDKLTGKVDEVAAAFEALGLTSTQKLIQNADEARDAFERIRDSGVASAQDISAAFDEYAKRALASGDDLTIVLARQDAEAYGLAQRWNDLVPAVRGVGEAYKSLGIQSTAALSEASEAARQNLNTIVASGAGVRDVEAAFAAYARTVIDSGDSVAREIAEQEAAVLGLTRQWQELVGTVSGLEAAYSELGLTSTQKLIENADAARDAFERIRESGTATANDIAAAYEVYARRALETGDTLTIALAKQDAQAYGLTSRWESLAPSVDALSQSYERLGITSTAALSQAAEAARRDFETILASGASVQDVESAFEAYAKTAIESGDKVAISIAAQNAEVLGLSDQWSKLLGSVDSAATSLLGRFDELVGKGNTAAASISKLFDELRFDTAAEAIANTSSVAELIRQLGTASEETGGKIRATAGDIREGLTPALDALSGEALLNFATGWEKATAAMGDSQFENAAVVLETVLGSALRKLGLDLENIREGTTATGREMVAAFEAAAIAARGLADAPEIIRKAFDAAAAAAKSKEDIDALREALTRLGEEGALPPAQIADALAELDVKLGEIEVQTREVEQAFRDLGIKSDESLRQSALRAQQAFEQIRDSEVTTLEDRKRAWEAYAAKAVASGDAVIMATARQEAAALGLLERYKELVSGQEKATSSAIKLAESQTRLGKVFQEAGIQGVKSMNDVRAAIGRLASAGELEALAAALRNAFEQGIIGAEEYQAALDEVLQKTRQLKDESAGGSRTVGSIDFEKVYSGEINLDEALPTKSAKRADIEFSNSVRQAYNDWVNRTKGDAYERRYSGDERETTKREPEQQVIKVVEIRLPGGMTARVVDDGGDDALMDFLRMLAEDRNITFT